MNTPSRREFLGWCGGLGLGALSGWASPMRGSADRQGDPFAPKASHHPARARSVIYLHMAGSPPQQDTFDPKPELSRRHGELCPLELVEGKRLAFIKGRPTLLGSPHGFIRSRNSDLEMSALLPHLANVADRMCVIRSMHTDEFNHAPAQLLLHTGASRFGQASMGSWAVHGLGTENPNLPGFVVMISGGTDPSGGKALWSSGFLPSHFQATPIRTPGDPVFFLTDPPGWSRASRRGTLDVLRALNEHAHRRTGDPETLSRTEQYDLAFRMQTAVPRALDVERESAQTRELYGLDGPRSEFATHCLFARRLVESGVRFVQLYNWGWDVHGTGGHDDLITQFPMKCREVDRPVAALLLDLERRGLLDETLVVFGGEFGRTAMNERRNGSSFLGRDHHPDAFTVWLAGGGVRGGHVHGETDPFGHTVVRDPVHVHDLQATILHLMGLNPHRLSVPFQGLDQRLIGPAEGPRVISEILA